MKKLLTVAFIAISMVANAKHGNELCDYELFRTQDTQVVCDMIKSLNQRYVQVGAVCWKSKDNKHVISMYNANGFIVFEKHCIK